MFQRVIRTIEGSLVVAGETVVRVSDRLRRRQPGNATNITRRVASAAGATILGVRGSSSRPAGRIGVDKCRGWRPDRLFQELATGRGAGLGQCVHYAAEPVAPQFRDPMSTLT